MSTIDINQFRDKVYHIRNRLHDKLYQELSREYKGKFSVLRNNIHITVKYRHSKEIVDLLDFRTLEITLDKENPMEIFQTTRKVGSNGEFMEIECIVIFNITSINRGKKDVLRLGNTGHTFNTYEEFLSRVSKEIDEPMDVRLIDRQTGIGLFHLFNQIANRPNTPQLELDNFYNLESYQKLDGETKAMVDSILCPFTITVEDVKVPYLGYTLIITLDKEQLMKEHFFTDKWNTIVNEELNY